IQAGRADGSLNRSNWEGSLPNSPAPSGRLWSDVRLGGMPAVAGGDVRRLRDVVVLNRLSNAFKSPFEGHTKPSPIHPTPCPRSGGWLCFAGLLHRSFPLCLCARGVSGGEASHRAIFAIAVAPF